MSSLASSSTFLKYLIYSSTDLADSKSLRAYVNYFFKVSQISFWISNYLGGRHSVSNFLVNLSIIARYLSYSSLVGAYKKEFTAAYKSFLN